MDNGSVAPEGFARPKTRWNRAAQPAHGEGNQLHAPSATVSITIVAMLSINQKRRRLQLTDLKGKLLVIVYAVPISTATLVMLGGTQLEATRLPPRKTGASPQNPYRQQSDFMTVELDHSFSLDRFHNLCHSRSFVNVNLILHLVTFWAPKKRREAVEPKPSEPSSCSLA